MPHQTEQPLPQNGDVMQLRARHKAWLPGSYCTVIELDPATLDGPDPLVVVCFVIGSLRESVPLSNLRLHG